MGCQARIVRHEIAFSSAIRIGLLAVAAALLWACGGHEMDEETRFDAATATDTCSASTLAWPAGATDDQKVCAGPWEYQCCDLGPQAVNTCKHAHAVADFPYVVTQRATCTNETCRWVREPGVSPEYLCTCWSWVFPVACSVDALGNAALAAVAEADTGCVDGPNGTFAAAPYPATATASAGTIVRTCTVTVKNVPTGHDGAVNKCDTAQDSSQCGWDESTRAFAKCDFTVTNADGTSPTEVPTEKCTQPDMYTGGDLPFSSVKSVATDGRVRNTPRCTSCEAIPTATDTQSKYTCLRDNLSRLGANALATAQVPDLAKRLVQRMELTYEFFGTQLAAEQQSNARSLYTTYPAYTPSCGQDPSLALPASPTGCTGNAAVVGKLTMCDRLADAHVPIALAQQDASYCTDAWSDVASLTQTAPSCSALPDYKAGWAHASTELLRKAMQVMSVPDASRYAELQNRMALSGRWYANRRAVADDPLYRWRDTEIVTGSLVQGAYYDRMQALDQVGLGGLTGRDELIQGSWTIDLEILNALLDAYGATGKPPLSGTSAAPAVFLLADALAATSERLSQADFQHDLGCRFLTCGKTKVSEMHRALGAIPDRSELYAAWLDAGDVPAEWNSIFYKLYDRHDDVVQPAVLDALGMDPANLSLYGPDLLRSADPMSVGVFALSQVASRSQAKATRYALTGRFRSGDTMALESNLLESTLGIVREKVAYYKAELENDRLEYQNEFAGLVDSQLTFIRAGNETSSLASEYEAKSQVILDTLDDMDALRISATVDAERFGEFAVQYQRLVEALQNAAGDGPYLQAEVTSLTASPFDAKWGDGPRPSVPELAVKALPVARNDLVRVEVSGQWSPTCAIEQVADTFTPRLANVAGAMTGPQGFQMAYSTVGQTYTAQETATTNFSDTDDAIRGGQAVGGFLGNAPNPYVAAAGQTIGMVATIADIFTDDESETATNGWRNTYESSAVFNHGLRVDTAPFPKFPAGALLAIRMKADDTTDAGILDVDIVQDPSTAIVVSSESAADGNQVLYFVVNDTSCRSGADDGSLGGLNVTVTRLMPLANVAVAVQGAMATSYEAIRTDIRAKLLNQGRILGTDLAALRDQSLSELYGACIGEGLSASMCDLSSFTSNLLTFYNAWISMQLNQAERQVELNDLRRRLRIDLIEFNALAAQIEGQVRVSQTATLMASRHLLNLDATTMRSNSEMLMKFVDLYLYPFLRAKYPETLTGEGLVGLGLLSDSDAQTAFHTISTQLDWTLGWDQHAANLLHATDQILKYLNEADATFAGNLGQVNQAVIVFAIRKPDSVPPILAPGKFACTTQPEPLGCSTTCDPCVLPGWPEGCSDSCVSCIKPPAPAGCTPDQVLAESDVSWTQYFTNGKPLFREMSPVLAREAWRQIVQGDPVQITIAPEDLYQNQNMSQPQFTRQLECTQLYPVIVAAGLHAATDSGFPASDYNLNPRVVRAHASRDITVVTPKALEQFFGANDVWLNFPVTVLAGYASHATDFFAALPTSDPVEMRRAGEGLSAILPKLTLEAGYRDVLDPPHFALDAVTGASVEHRHTMALLLILKVEYRNAGKEPTWLRTRCLP